jgi:hypothetical protein
MKGPESLDFTPYVFLVRHDLRIGVPANHAAR